MTNAPTEAIRVDGLTLLAPTASRPVWRIKGMLPDGTRYDTTAGRTLNEAIAKAQRANAAALGTAQALVSVTPSALPNGLDSSVRVGDLTLTPPAGKRAYWRIKGTLPSGAAVDTTGGRTLADARAKAAAVVSDAQRLANPGSAHHGSVLYGVVLQEFLKPQNHDTWGRNGGSRYADNTKGLLYNHVLPVLASIHR